MKARNEAKALLRLTDFPLQRLQVASVDCSPPRTLSKPNAEAQIPLLVAQCKCQVEFGAGCAIMCTVDCLAHGKFFSVSLPIQELISGAPNLQGLP